MIQQHNFGIHKVKKKKKKKDEFIIRLYENARDIEMPGLFPYFPDYSTELTKKFYTAKLEYTKDPPIFLK